MNKKIYACYSPSHKPLLDEHFLPTIPSGFDVILRRFDQVCPTGNFMSEKWGEAVEHKIRFILEAIDSEKEPFLYSDVDVRFYDFHPQDLEDAMAPRAGTVPDLRCQQDQNYFCLGFMFVRPCSSVKKLFEITLQSTRNYNDDETAFNQFALPELKKMNEYPLDISLLPRERYWNIDDQWNGIAPWEGVIPPRIAIHHGNYTVGIPNKMSLLNHIKSRKI